MFFARTPEELLEFNAARRPDPETGAPDVAKVGEYLGRHPEAVPAVTAALTNTQPAVAIGPFVQWSNARAIVSLDPWGHMVAEAFQPEIAEGIDIRPSIAVTRARLDLYEMQQAVAAGRLANDGTVVQPNGGLSVVKIAIDPVWYLPGIAERFGVTETSLRRTLFEQTAGMFPELVTRPDLQVFLPRYARQILAPRRRS